MDDHIVSILLHSQEADVHQQAFVQVPVPYLLNHIQLVRYPCTVQKTTCQPPLGELISFGQRGIAKESA